MNSTLEQQKDVAYSQAFLKQWLESGSTPKQVLDAFKQVSEGYDRTRKELEDQAAKHKREMDHVKLLAEGQKILVDAQATSLAVSNRADEIDDLNDGADEQRIMVGEFQGWNLVGGIRFGRAAVINDGFDWSPLSKVLIAPMRRAFLTDFDIFPLAVKRGIGAGIDKFVVDFTKTLK